MFGENAIPIVALVIAALGVGITLIVLMLRGGFIMGRLSNQVEAQAKAIDALAASVNYLRAEAQQREQRLLATISELRAEVQQSNQTLAALANHTHDTDGRTVFQVPTPASR